MSNASVNAETRLTLLVNDSDHYMCVGKPIRGHQAFVHALPEKKVECNMHFHDADPHYRVYTKKGWGDIWEKDYFIWVQWDGTNEKVNAGKAAGGDFILTILSTGELTASSK